MDPGFFNMDHKDGITVPDPGNSRKLLTMVGTWSEQDPSWEVRTFYLAPQSDCSRLRTYANFQEARWRYYLVTRLPWAPFHSQASVSQDARHSGLNPDDPPLSVTAGDGNSVTSSSTCSQCIARLASSGQRDDETQGHEGAAESVCTGTSDCKL